MTQYIDLVLDGGELVRIECPEKHYDEFMDALDNARKRNDWLSSMMFDGLKFNYIGHRIERINCAKIVATL